jgi:thymidylate synthase (FAD)
MKIIRPSWSFDKPVNGDDALLLLERVGRTCYKTEAKITEGSSHKFVRQRIDEGHDAVIEFEDVIVRVICDRGVTHEIVRHRIASYAQESTRYCNYGHAGEITVILPPWFAGVHAAYERGPVYVHSSEEHHRAEQYQAWRAAMNMAEVTYLHLLELGQSPQQARAVLPNSLKSEIVIKMNLREWRHFFRLRTSRKAHPQMREITIPMLAGFKEAIPIVFDDIVAEEGSDGRQS